MKFMIDSKSGTGGLAVAASISKCQLNVFLLVLESRSAATESRSDKLPQSDSCCPYAAQRSYSGLVFVLVRCWASLAAARA